MGSKKIKVCVPGTIGNVGPGFDVLGLCLSGVADTITVELTEQLPEITAISGRDSDKIPIDPEKNAASIAADYLLKKMHSPLNSRISIDRELPLSGGLGASAAAAVGGAIGAYVGLHPETKDGFQDIPLILEAALEAEKKVAGKHLDNIAPCLGGGLAIVRSLNPPQFHNFKLSHPWKVVVLSPMLKLPTKEARAVLADSLKTKEWTLQMGRAIGVATALITGEEELLSASLVDTFAEPKRSELIPFLHEVKTEAMQNGALGCSISGAGPSIFAITLASHAESCAQAMKNACPEESTVHICSVNNTGAYLI